MNSEYRLDPRLLDVDADREKSEFEAVGGSVRGQYSTFEFVLRLSQPVHERLALRAKAIESGEKPSLEDAEAFSVYLHETIHWWQHVGSTYGLVLSMTYPAELHLNYLHLHNLTRQVGFKKSLRKFVELSEDGGDPGTPAGLANVIVNNQFDFHAFRCITLRPDYRESVVTAPLFESVGHALKVAYGAAVAVLGTVADPDYEVLPNPEVWHPDMLALRDQEHEGYFYGSPVRIHPVGAFQILEGQARMVQMQFLSFACGHRVGWEQFRELGMLKGVYGEAFELFLKEAELDCPESVDHPVVALFMLICDMAINPGAGFPFTVRHPSAFIEDVDPGARFVALCFAVAKLCPEVAGTIKNYSFDEYVEVSEKLAAALVINPPLAIAEEVASWPARSEGFRALMREWETFDFSAGNLPVRVMLSHFVAFMADKALRPEFFCWPGAWCAGRNLSKESHALFDKHAALFMDRLGDAGVFPRVTPGRDPELVQATFQAFFGVVTVYDLTRQWITQKGPFSFRFGWMVEGADAQLMEAFASANFEHAFGVTPSDVEIL